MNNHLQEIYFIDRERCRAYKDWMGGKIYSILLQKLET